MKRCNKCRDTKPLDAFYKDKGRSDGLKSCCKECDNAANRAYREADTSEKAQERAARRAEKKALAEQGMKPCFDCDEAKPFGEFRKQPSHRDGLESYCRPCQDIRISAWLKRHPERVRAKERKKEAVRRAREEGMPVFLVSPKDQRRLGLSACAHAHLGGCKGVITEDHVIPVSKPGSSHGIGNLQAMCVMHNSRKQGKWEVEARYAPQLEALRAQRDDLVESVLLAREILRVIEGAQRVHA